MMIIKRVMKGTYHIHCDAGFVLVYNVSKSIGQL